MKILDVLGGFSCEGDSSYSMRVSHEDREAVVEINSTTYEQLADFIKVGAKNKKPKYLNSEVRDAPVGIDVSTKSSSSGDDVFSDIPDNMMDELAPSGMFSGPKESAPKNKSPYKDPDGLDVI
jgi:hypothetical protein